MSADTWYIDTSALVKTAIEEPESTALLAWLQGNRRLISCAITWVEAVRAVRVSAPVRLPGLRVRLNTLDRIHLDEDVLTMAADLDPPPLRSLDAIHLAAALSIGPDLAGIATYDARMAAAARELGLTVESPGRQADRSSSHTLPP